MKPHDETQSPPHEPPRMPGERAPTTSEILAWYRERDHDPEDLHRRYVRAKFRMVDWSDEDLARFHRYRRSVSRERAAQLVIVRRHAVRGATAAAVVAVAAAALYAAIEWWRRKTAPPALPAGSAGPRATVATPGVSTTSSARSAAAPAGSRGEVEA